MSETPATPIILYGALRSGTTVFRLMLDAHPALRAEGEADYLFDHIDRDEDGRWRYDLRALRADRVFRAREIALPEGLDGPDLLAAMVDSLNRKGSGRTIISVHRHYPKVAALLPDAPVIHLVRDPRAVALSCREIGFSGDVWRGVDYWLAAERDWDSGVHLTPQTQRVDLRYESLIADMKAELSRVLAVAGLDYDPAQARYHAGTTYDAPDPSRVNNWRKRYGARELALVEGKLGWMLTDRGYAPMATQPVSPGALERLWLRAAERWRRWMHDIRIYGLRLFLADRLAKAPGLGFLAEITRRQRDEILTRRLK